MMSAPLRILLFVYLVLIPAVGIWAHPHVFVSVKATFLFDNGNLTGVRQEWLFDEVFGSSVILDYDRNKDGKFSEAEIKKIKAEAFDNLANYGYFTFLSVDGVRKKDLKIADFAATVVGDSVAYAFTVPCPVNRGPKTHAVKLIVYDNEYFVAFDPLRSGDVTLSPAGAPAAVGLGRAGAQALYPGQAMPDEVTLTVAAAQ